MYRLARAATCIVSLMGSGSRPRVEQGFMNDLHTTDPVHMSDFQAQWRGTRDATLAAVERVGASGRFVLGAEVAAFEEELSAFWGMPLAVGCASGLDAIEIALRCAGLQPGQRVLTTPLSAFASTLAVRRAGGIPVFVDVDDTGLLDLALAERALEEHRDVRFLLLVHLYGQAADADRLARLRERFELLVIEDCAQSIGASSRGTPTGATSHASATSFYPTKNLGCLGDGGAVLTASAECAELARSLRDYGQTDKYVHRHFGLNSRLDEIQAAILRDAFLPGLSDRIARRRSIAARYDAELRNPHLQLPKRPEGSDGAWHLYPVLVSGSRSSFQRHLERARIFSDVHYPTLIPYQAALDVDRSMLLTPLSKAQGFASREVSLPIHPFLDDRSIERVVEACNSWRP